MITTYIFMLVLFTNGTTGMKLKSHERVSFYIETHMIADKFKQTMDMATWMSKAFLPGGLDWSVPNVSVTIYLFFSF